MAPLPGTKDIASALLRGDLIQFPGEPGFQVVLKQLLKPRQRMYYRAGGFLEFWCSDFEHGSLNCQERNTAPTKIFMNCLGR